MTARTKLTDAHIGKFTVVDADGKKIPVRIVSVGGSMVVVMVLDQTLPLRSLKMRYDENKEIDIYDTAEEAQAWEG